MKPALRAALVATPVFLAACAVPDGGLFRAARFRDVHVYQGYAERFLHGALPYRDVFVEYPPGAFAVFLPPAAFGASHYNAAFKTLMALCGAATIVLVPLAAWLVWRRAGTRRTALALGVLVLVAAAIVVPFAAYAPHGVYESFHSQAARGLQVESLGAAVLLALDRLGLYHAHVVETTGVAGRNLTGGTADAVAAVLLVLEGLAVATVWVLYARLGDLRARLPLAFAAAVAGFLAFTKVFSPQYLVWLLPLVVAGGGAVPVALTAVALVLAQIWFFHYAALFALGWPVWLLLVRDLVMVALYAVLAAELARWKIRIPSRSKTSRHSGLRRNQESWTTVGKGASRSA